MRTVPDNVANRHHARSSVADPGEDAGFTLIELMVVLLILAILLAIAIPTFLGVTGGANDKAAQSNLNTALTTAKTYAEQNGQNYGTAGGGVLLNTTILASNEPSISWISAVGGTTAQGAVSVWVSTDGNGIILASPSKNNTNCWFVVDNIANVAGNATTNGLYTGTTVAGASGNGTAVTTAPTAAGTYYGESSTGTCSAQNVGFTAANKLYFATSFTAANH